MTRSSGTSRRVFGILVVVSLSLCVSGRVWASDALDLRWTAPAGCPNADSVTAAVDRLIGAPPAEPLRAEVTLERFDGDRTRASIRTGEGRGERTLEGESCRAVAEATVLVLALAIDPEAAARAEAEPVVLPAPPPEPATPTKPAPKPAPKPPKKSKPPAPPLGKPVPTERKREPHRFGVWVLGVGEAGALPGPTVGGSIGARYEFGVWSAELGGTYFLPRRGEHPEIPSTGGDFSWLVGGGGFCGALARPSPRLEACGGLEVGQVSGEGFGVTNPGKGSALWIAGTLGGKLHIFLGEHLALTTTLVAAFPMRRQYFVIENVGRVHRPSAVSGRVGLGALFAF